MIRKKVRLTAWEYEKVCKSIQGNWLSDYGLQQEDCIAYFQKDQLLGYVRVFEIGKKKAELSSLFVDPQYRNQGYARQLIQDAIHSKLKAGYELYLACKEELYDFYQKLGFVKITSSIPAKLLGTLQRAREHHKSMIIMKRREKTDSSLVSKHEKKRIQLPS